ncbi:hypothetical protein [Pseudomonas sp. UBA1879]|uniref:hypothetical protein n=1 Tax=Pseudomonas sp. UBA1879 TaxID=1947305 RepID=UPI0025CBB765|nr:hypothetical protein [Pseudomonas sp. UBA1879]
MRLRTLINIALVKMAQVAFIFVLTIALGYCVLNLKPVQWLFDSWIGASAHRWFLEAMGSKDLRDMLDCFTIMWLSMTPSIAVWICVLLTRYLRREMRPAQSAQR